MKKSKSPTNSKKGKSYPSPIVLKKLKEKNNRKYSIGCSDDTFYPS